MSIVVDTQAYARRDRYFLAASSDSGTTVLASSAGSHDIELDTVRDICVTSPYTSRTHLVAGTLKDPPMYSLILDS